MRASADELREPGKTVEEVMAECRAREEEMRELGRRVIGNWFEVINFGP